MADHFILVHGHSKAEALILAGQTLQFAIGPIAVLFLAWKIAYLQYNANQVTSLLAQNTHMYRRYIGIDIHTSKNAHHNMYK